MSGEWVQVGGGNFLKWTTPGQSIEGRWCGTRDGKYGALGIMDTSTGRWSFPIQTSLVDKVDVLEVGDEVKIVYTGKQKAKGSGNEFKAFDVFTKPKAKTPSAEDPRSDDPALRDPSAPQPGDDDLP